MRVAVTGTSGFVGGAVAQALVARGDEVVSVGRTIPADPALAATHLAWDLASGDGAPGVLRDVDAVVHAAARVAPWGLAGPFHRTTVEGTRRLLDGVGARTRLVVIGSASVYDPRRAAAVDTPAREPEGPVDDSRYLNAYARAKAAQELVVRRTRPDALVLRPRAVWGPGDRALLPRLLARVRGSILPLPAGGRHAASFTFIDSLVGAVVAGLDHPAVSGPVNVADATPIAPARLVETLGDALGRRIRVVPVPVVLAGVAGAAVEAVYAAAGSRREPPVSRYAVAAFAVPHVLDLHRIHDELELAADAELQAAIVLVADDLRRRGVVEPSAGRAQRRRQP
ncbi:MAG TPA: NAD(P)-dependent oxidoreductase [Candidatus Limnocylindrales bacterium]|nr:NAD(P)-dependent oxidoreductase [Candidatus Limnocylindrales bacterium]